MKLIQKIDELEKEKVEELIEKKNALSNLKIVLEEKGSKQLMDKCIDELEKVEKEYLLWWNEAIRKYELHTYERSSLFVDVMKEAIFLI